MKNREKKLANSKVYAGCLDNYDSSVANACGEITMAEFVNTITEDDISNGNYCEAMIEDMVNALKRYFKV